MVFYDNSDHNLKVPKVDEMKIIAGSKIYCINNILSNSVVIGKAITYKLQDEKYIDFCIYSNGIILCSDIYQ